VRAAAAIVLLALAAAPPGARADGPRDLAPNGGFEAGADAPAGWQRPDGLTSFWVREGRGGGRCMRFDTDVKVDEFYARRDEMARPAPPPARPKSPTRRPDYGTVAGLDGVSFYSDFIDVAPGMRYTLAAAARAEQAGMQPKIFLKGYAESEEEVAGERGEKVRRTFRRVRWKVFLDCPCGVEWRDFSATVCPTAADPEVRWVRIMLFCYWPQGTYWFDDVRLVEAGLDPAAEAHWAADREGRAAAARRAREREVDEARATIRFVAAALERYRADTGAYPTTAQGLAPLWAAPPGVAGWAGPYVPELDLDPWGAPYRYCSPGRRHADGFDLASWGPDGAEGGGDDVEN
jgi:type II secretion system protein G